jgi:hypothetical protein
MTPNTVFCVDTARGTFHVCLRTLPPPPGRRPPGQQHAVPPSAPAPTWRSSSSSSLSCPPSSPSGPSPFSSSSGSCSPTSPPPASSRSNRRRPRRVLAGAVAALGLALLGLVTLAGPAHAVDPSTAGRAAGCVLGAIGCEAGSAIGGAAGGAVETVKGACDNQPKPDDPQAGFGAVLAPKPPGASQDPFATDAGLYQRYGYGGYQLPIYVEGEGPAGCVRAAAAGPGSFFANTSLRGMVWLVALGGFLNRVGHVHSYWDILDPAAESASQLAQRLLWGDGGVLSLAIGILALVCLWIGLRGKVSVCINLAATAFLVLLLGHAAAFKGVEASHWLRDNVTGITDMFHDSADDPDAPPASDIVQRELLYRTWTAAMFGDADGPAAIEYGPRLFDSMTWRWDEPQDTETLERKQETTRQLMGELTKKYPVAAGYARGDETSAQAGTTVLGFIAALFVAGWEIFAGLAGFVLNAVCTLIVPAVAFTVPFALFKAGLAHLRRLGEMLVGIGIKAVICSIVAQLVAAAEGAVLGAGTIPWILKVLFMVTIAGVAWAFTQRHRKLLNGAVDRRVQRAADASLKLAGLAATAAGAAAGVAVPPMMGEEYSKKSAKKHKAGRDAAAAGGAAPATAEAATPPAAADGWVAPTLALPAAGRTVPSGRPPLAWEHGATGPAPGPGTYRRADGTWATADAGTRPVAALGPGRFALPAGDGSVHDPVIHSEQHRRLVEAMHGTVPAHAEAGTFDRQLTGMYVAGGHGRPVIDVHGWVAPAASTTGGQTTTQTTTTSTTSIPAPVRVRPPSTSRPIPPAPGGPS